MLDHTTNEIKERKGLVVNPAKTCQPIGAMYAALGIHNCLPHSHGSQGCCSFHRMHLTRHYRDPIVASSSSFTEGASVFGGVANLKKGLKNVFAIYDPDVVAISTTCLSETIGDDIPTIIYDSEIPAGKHVFHANTPSYSGSHVTGFSNMVKAMVNHFSEKTEGTKNGKVNIIPGYVEPGDMRELKRIAKLMDIPHILFPDTSGVVDSPMTGKYEMYPKGGTTVEDLIDTGNSMATIAIGEFASWDAGNELENKCDIDHHAIYLPIGIKATDEYIMELVKITGKSVPYELEEERGQLVDIMTDIHHHYHGKKVAIFGDPDHVISMTEFVVGLGMIPSYVVTGTKGKKIETRIKKIFKDSGIDGKVKAGGDLFQLHQWIKNNPVDLLIGNTYGKYIARAEDIPLVRFGFPILDRSVHSYFPIVGYKGAMRLIEMISNTLLERVDRDAADEDFELVL